MSPLPVNVRFSNTSLCGPAPYSCSSLLLRRLLLLLLLLALHGDLGGAQGRRHRHRRLDSDRFSYSSGRIRALNSECYHRGRAQKCMPNFDNVVHNRPVEATSTCGSPPSRVCRTREVDGRMKRICSLCDASVTSKSHPPSYLTDRHDPRNETCWISGPISHESPSVNLTISFGKRFEILYIYLVPCGSIPDSITLYKSSDFGKSWRPWRYFSSNCYRAFGLPTTDERVYSFGGPNIQEAFCEQLKPLRAYTGRNAERIVFSTTTGQMSNSNPALIDWRTATDLRVVLNRFPLRGGSNGGTKVDRVTPAQVQGVRHQQFDEPGVMHYSFAQISVGGRCKCNGHSNRCVWKNSKLVCDCKHNTEGDDCERCKPFFYDRPWARATDTDANVCRQCECNLHSNRCTFNKEVFLISSRTSGGVCQRCRHNTAGRACHYCQDGHYRDWTKPVSHERVCVVCNCHPLGSVKLRSCDKKSGQCQCKPGVTGQICDRCIEGYRQSNDPNQPCKSDTSSAPIAGETYIDFPTSPSSGQRAPRCKKCTMRKRRIRFKKFCRKHYAMQVSIMSRSTIGNNVRFLIEVRAVYRRASQAESVLPPRRINHPVPLWVPYQNLRCQCPNLLVGRSYLIISNVRTIYFQNRRELLLYRRSIVLDWQNAWKRRMNKYKRRDRRGRCEHILRRRKNRGRKKVPDSSHLSRSTSRFNDFRPSYQLDYQRSQYLTNYQNNFDNYGYYGYNKKRT